MPASKNGLTPPQIKTRKVELEDPYAGYWFVVQTNPPMGAVADLMSGVPDRMMECLKEIVFEWNFIGFDGKALNLKGDGLRKLPFDLFQAMSAAATNAPFEVEKNS